MEKRKIKRLRSVYGNPWCKSSGTHSEEEMEEKDGNKEESELLKTLYEDVETGIKITIYRNEINGKITRNNLDKIARRGSASISDKTHSKKPKSIKLIYLHTQNKSFLLFFYFFLVL